MPSNASNNPIEEWQMGYFFTLSKACGYGTKKIGFSELKQFSPKLTSTAKKTNTRLVFLYVLNYASNDANSLRAASI